jgi:hypothetical protein
MVLVTGNWKVWLIGMAASLVLFGIIYFAVIAPDQNAANQAIKSGLQQSQQALKQAQQQINSATGQAGAASAQTSTAATQATQVVSKTEKLASCLAAAGTDVSKVQACQAQY